MNANEGLLVVLIVILICVLYSQKMGKSVPQKKDNFTCSAPAGGTLRTPVQMQDGALRTARHDAYNQPHAYQTADLAKNYRAWAAGPRDLEEAQREAWFEAVSDGNTAPFNPETACSAGADALGHHTPGPSINYQDALVDLVADPRMRAQQENWYSEIAPKSQTALKVDTMDEAAAISNYNGQGLYAFRFSAPSQHNPLFITDQDAESYADHATKFTFGG